MSESAWSFDDCVLRLRKERDLLERLGSSVHLEVRLTDRASARLRAENGKCLGELTVWEDGVAYMAVVNLDSGEFVFEHDGVVLTEPQSEVVLARFFERLRS